MNIFVEFKNKDLVKKLGCKWVDGAWICPYNNTDSNIDQLLKLQSQGKIAFPKGDVDSSYQPKDGEDVILRGSTYAYRHLIGHNRKEIYDMIAKFNSKPIPKPVQKNYIKSSKASVSDFDSDSDDDNIVAEEKIISNKIKLLKEEEHKQYNVMIKKHEEEKSALKLYFEKEEQHLKNCIFRDYEQNTRSWVNYLNNKI